MHSKFRCSSNDGVLFPTRKGKLIMSDGQVHGAALQGAAENISILAGASGVSLICEKKQ
jgi:hypothetical protein